MNRADQNNDFLNDDLIDSIANGMAAEWRADYYREMRHLRSLPHNDEMLHIVKIMQFPMSMMVDIPQRLAMEREKLERAIGECIVLLQQTNERLARLPENVASGISPEAIAGKINESLRQQFLKSTIPQTGQALTVVAGKIEQAVAGLEQGTPKIVAAHKHVTLEAVRAIREMKSGISDATATARQATAELSSTYLHEYRWALGVLLVLALILGFLFGNFLGGSGYLPSFGPTHEAVPAASPRTRR